MSVAVYLFPSLNANSAVVAMPPADNINRARFFTMPLVAHLLDTRRVMCWRDRQRERTFAVEVVNNSKADGLAWAGLVATARWVWNLNDAPRLPSHHSA